MPADNSQHQFIPAWKVDEPRAIAAAPDEGAESAAQVAKRHAKAGLVRFSSKWRERLAGGTEGDPMLVEQFRRLAATLHHAHLNNGLRSVMVTSALPGDGKTLTSVNLALVLADSYRYNVLLIDADLRRPSIPHVVELGEGSGLSEALRAPTAHKVALVPITSRLTLLPAGQPVANSIEALTSPRMRQILSEAEQRFDWVIVDAPPVGPTTDARILTQMVGGTLFVIHAARTPHHDVQKAVDGLGREQILGVVLNGVAGGPPNLYY
jgi:protein-tyrosine kinase